jgi:hypothetical protein
VADSVRQEKDAFDLHWDTLAEARDSKDAYPDFVPKELSTLKAKKRRISVYVESTYSRRRLTRSINRTGMLPMQRYSTPVISSVATFF